MLSAQFEKVDKGNVNTYSVLADGGHILGIDELYITITDLEYNKMHDIYKVSGFIQNAYNRDNSTDTFDVAVYDSVGATHLNNNYSTYQEYVKPIYRLVIYRNGLFTLYMKKAEVAEINGPGATYPARIAIRNR
jgi:hypothetical protein